MVKVGLGLWVHWRCCSDNSLPTHIIRLTPFKALPFHNHCCVQAKPRRDGSRQWPSNPASLGYLGLNHTSFPFAIPYERLLNDLFSFFELLTKGMATPAHPGTVGFMRYWKLEVKARTLDSGRPHLILTSLIISVWPSVMPTDLSIFRFTCCVKRGQWYLLLGLWGFHRAVQWCAWCWARLNNHKFFLPDSDSFLGSRIDSLKEGSWFNTPGTYDELFRPPLISLL